MLWKMIAMRFSDWGLRCSSAQRMASRATQLSSASSGAKYGSPSPLSSRVAMG